jgi:uncharacterized membrane protein
LALGKSDAPLVSVAAEEGSDLNPVLTAFSHGIRAYYFALTAAAWLLGPALFLAGTLAAIVTLVYRQPSSRSARAVRRARALLDD